MSQNVILKYKLMEKCNCSDRQHLDIKYHDVSCRYRVWMEAKLERHRLAYLKEQVDAGKRPLNTKLWR